jgi:hypothetical protein
MKHKKIRIINKGFMHILKYKFQKYCAKQNGLLWKDS